ncbi:ATP-binding protein [Ruegeria sp. ANG-R]|uniref:ATP-binding protein n=1 Tax=Ruegeria sp. ANG-R TaxID=1577903 RepID=UPI00126A0581|nr:ATP-binding protein [Ruegeria sp. ANG-R]
MTQLNPNLMIRRLKIVKSGSAVFDEYFHRGLNIIRGQNSSGKSTIMDFLYYSLGGDVEKGHWREAAAGCDSVIVEISANISRSMIVFIRLLVSTLKALTRSVCRVTEHGSPRPRQVGSLA